MGSKKQLKINRLFKKMGTRATQHEDEEELEEIRLLEQKLKEKQIELFKLQRDSYRKKRTVNIKETDDFARPQRLELKNSVEQLKKDLELMSMLTGMEVKSYEANKECVIVYHMQHRAPHIVQHGLKINMRSGENEVEMVSLPTGFNYKAVLEEFDNVMTPKCLASLRNALVAYYDRLEQFQKLEKMLSVEAQFFKLMDGSHVEISFKIQPVDDEEEEPVNVVLVLDYRAYDIRPKQYSFKDSDLTEESLGMLKKQSALLKRKPLHKAFRDCFMEGNGPYVFVHQVGHPHEEQIKRKPKKPVRAAKYNHNVDDTFKPDDEEPSDSSEEEDERQLGKIYGRH